MEQMEDGLFYQIAHLKKTFSGRILGWCHRKFLQIWNLNNIIALGMKKINKDFDIKFNLKFQKWFKDDTSINAFWFTVSIALFYESYKIFNSYLNSEISNKCLTENIIKLMKLMIPFTPHLANECLELMKCKNKFEWPKIEKTNKTI